MITIQLPHLILIRWLVEAGVHIASEKKQRLLSKELVSTDIISEAYFQESEILQEQRKISELL